MATEAAAAAGDPGVSRRDAHPATAGARPRYLSYLLRLWQVPGEGPWSWQASLESTSGERTGFPDLAALFTFLTAATGGESPPAATAAAEPGQLAEPGPARGSTSTADEGQVDGRRAGD